MDLAQVPFIFTNRRARLIDFYSLRELEDGAGIALLIKLLNFFNNY